MDSKAELLLNGKNLVFLATTMPDGSPQVTPVWGNFEDSHILINTGRSFEAQNILRDPRVASRLLIRESSYMTSIREKNEIILIMSINTLIFLTKQYMGKKNLQTSWREKNHTQN